MNSVTGQPISGALVVLESEARQRLSRTAEQASAAQRALTDASGRFSFPASPKHFFQLKVSRRGFRSESQSDLAYISPRPESAQTIVVRLVPLGAFHGRVVNSDGEPLPDVTVQAIRIEIRGGRRGLREYASKTTDDLGEYRLWHLSPGSYYLKVLGRTACLTCVGAAPTFSGGDEAYGPVYYPSAEGHSTAQPMRLSAGEAARADFAVTSRRAYKIRGTIRGFTPYDRMEIRLLRGSDNVGNRVTINPASGVFEVSDVTPGVYVVQAYTKTANPPAVGEAVVSLIDRDVTGVVVPMGAGVEVRGTVEFSGESGTSRRRAVVRATPTAPDRLPVRSSTGEQAEVQDGKFKLRLLPGTYEFSANAPGFYVSSIRSGTVDVLGESLTVSDAGVQEVKIELTAGGAQIEGTIENAAPEKRATVALVRKHASSLIATIVYPHEGRFIAANLAPGEYTVVGWVGDQEIEYHNPAVLQTMSANAVTLWLRDGTIEKVRLKAVSTEAQ